MCAYVYENVRVLEFVCICSFIQTLVEEEQVQFDDGVESDPEYVAAGAGE